MENPRAFWAAIITGVIWVAVGAISVIFMGMEGVSALGAAIFIVIMAGIAVGGTAVVWGTEADRPVERSERAAARARRARKSKRIDPERLERLMEVLDEDELIELESLLMAQRETGPYDVE
ncbi:MAG: hypothetical protein Kow0077_01160 [Anaerolineae bacterium]